ncbi:MAG: GNAT family N-acetyltransferase [Bryobacterales bacterium]|nr:GNAT family N-acetyltransferase [Bryobacterales bacterium]
MIFSDLPLSRRLERAEATASSKFIEARARTTPISNAAWIEIAGAYAMFDGADSPLTQTFGLGLFAEPSAADLDQLEAFFQKRHAPVCHEVSPLAGVELVQALTDRGYRPIEFTSVMHRSVQSPDSAPSSAVTARRIATGEESLWSRLSAEGWSSNPELRDFLLDLGIVISAAEGSFAFLAELDGQPIATAALRCDDGVALFAGASTIVSARNRGAQRALLEARMVYAAAAGCDLAMMCAAPGSPSQRNAERQGFRIAYTRTKWCLAPR